MILATLPDAFVGGILALLLAGETWNVSSLVGPDRPVRHRRAERPRARSRRRAALVAEGRPFEEALREASLGRVRPKMHDRGAPRSWACCRCSCCALHGTEIERPLAIVMVGGLVTSTLFTLLALPTFYLLVHQAQQRLRRS